MAEAGEPLRGDRGIPRRIPRPAPWGEAGRTCTDRPWSTRPGPLEATPDGRVTSPTRTRQLTSKAFGEVHHRDRTCHGSPSRVPQVHLVVTRHADRPAV